MVYAKLRVYTAVCLILTSGASAGEHQAISIDDVLAGIEARRSQIHDIELDVSYRSETTKEGWALQREAQARYSVDFDERDYDDMMLVSTRANRFAARDRSMYLEDVVTDDTGAIAVEAKRVYDGQFFKFLHLESRSGGIRQAEPVEFIPNPLVPDDLLRIYAEGRGHDYYDYLRRADVDKGVVAVRSADADVMVELNLKRRNPQVHEGLTLIDSRQEHVVVINASRGFWPVEIRAFDVYESFHESFYNPGIKPGQKVLQSVVLVEELVENNGCFYPRRITRDRYVSKDATRAEVVLSTTESLEFSKVLINSGIPHSRFDLAFPPGTRFSKPGDSRVYMVNPDETIRDLTAELPHPHLPLSDFTKEEADKILRSARSETARGRGGDGWGRTVVVLLSLGVLSLMLGRFSAKKLAMYLEDKRRR